MMDRHSHPPFVVVIILVSLLTSCSIFTGLLADTLLDSGKKGGINTELVVGDKEQVLGTNLDVKAKNIGKVTGTSDNSVSAPGAEQVEITNNTFPVWAIFLIGGLATLIGYLAPRPQAWKRFIGKQNDNSK